MWGRGLRTVGFPGQGAPPPGASRCSARKLATHSFPPRPPDEGPIRQRQRVQALIGCRNNHGVSATPAEVGHRNTARFSTYTGGRGGKECVASLRAEQRLAPGGGAPCPGKPTVRSPLPRKTYCAEPRELTMRGPSL